MRVVIAAGNRLAGQAVRAALEAISDVSVVAEPRPDGRRGDAARASADLVIVDLTLSSIVDQQLRRLSLDWPGAVIVSIELRRADEYSWVRARPVGPWFAVDAFGAGTIDQVVRAATLRDGAGVDALPLGMAAP